MDKDKQIVANQIGYLILKDDGAVLESGGDLKNDERSANVIMGLLNLTESIDDNFISNSSCERISIDYEHHSYCICMSNRHIYVVKQSKNHNGTAPTSSSSSTSVYNDANEGSNSLITNTAGTSSSAVMA